MKKTARLTVGLPKDRGGLRVMCIDPEYYEGKEDFFEMRLTDVMDKVGDGGPKDRKDWDVLDRIINYTDIDNLMYQIFSAGEDAHDFLKYGEH